MVTDLDVTSYKNYDNHTALFTFIDPPTKTQGFVAFYRFNTRFPAFGATRVWNYNSMRDGVEDALQLAKMMMYKNAMAGSPYGGAKGILMTSLLDLQQRRELLLRYAQFTNFLSGRFVTGADVGVSLNDIKAMKKVCRNYIVGTKVDPVEYTVLGLLSALNIASEEVFGSADLKHKTIAVQGVGKVGAMLVRAIHDKVKTLYLADTNPQAIKHLSDLYKNILVVAPGDIHKQKVDIFCPCAMSGTLNKTSIKKLKAELIVGSANNQLKSIEIGEELHKMGIFYAPDYVVNAGGVMSVIHEYEHRKILKKELEEKIKKKIGTNLRKVIRHAHNHNISISKAADQLTERIILKRDKIQ